MSEFFAVDNAKALTPEQSKIFESAMSPAWSNCSRSYSSNKVTPVQSTRSNRESSSSRKLSSKLKNFFR